MSALAPIRAEADGPVRAAFTTRPGGVSAGAWAGLNLGASTGDDPGAVRVNRARLCDHLGLEAERVSMCHQVHGAQVHWAGAPPRPGRFTGGLRGWPQGDGLATARPGLALVVLGADCPPVLLWRRDLPRVAAAHAGWRGLVGGVLEAAVRALGRPAATAAAIGPGVGPCCYPVSGELRRRFAAAFGDEVVHGAAVDLAHAARRALRAAGLPGDAVTAVAGCTACEPARLYSHRRDGGTSGRQAGVVWIAEGA